MTAKIGKPEISFFTKGGPIVNVEHQSRPSIDTLVSGEALLKRQDVHAPLSSDTIYHGGEMHVRATRLSAVDMDGPIEYIDTQIRIPVHVGMSQDDRVKLANQLAEIVQEGLKKIVGAGE